MSQTSPLPGPRARRTKNLARAAALSAAAFLLAWTPGTRGEDSDFPAAAQAAAAKVEAVTPAAQALLAAGDLRGSEEKFLAAFPAKTRSPAEQFILGNLFFDTDPRQSFPLHQAAAKADPNNPTIAWEWGLEQHRAKDYAGALAAYQLFSKSDPGSAMPYALEADCLLRLGRIDEAVAAWGKSETGHGSIEAMEDLVCAVHFDPGSYARRTDLLAKATQQRDADAAAELIALDCDFPRDWWNAGVYGAFLAHDVPAVLGALKLLPDDPLARSIACCAQCALANPDDAGAIKTALTGFRLLIDPAQTVPSNSRLLSGILALAVPAKAIDETTLHEKLAPKLEALARKGHDPVLWNCAAYCAPQTPANARLEFERAGWKATGDPRFADGVLYIKSQAAPVAGNDPDLLAALKQFPEDGAVQHVAVFAAAREKKLSRAILARAAEAEFTHFSSFVAPVTVVNRPRSGYLRGYFGLMEKLPPAGH